jgi:hypothetical protein
MPIGLDKGAGGCLTDVLVRVSQEFGYGRQKPRHHNRAGAKAEKGRSRVSNMGP